MRSCLIILALIQIVSSYNSPQYIHYMTNKHHKLVPYYGYRYLKGKYLPSQVKEDILQEGYIGLTQAARKYDESRNVSFSYYSRFWIMRYFSTYLKKYYKTTKPLYPINDKILGDTEYPGINLLDYQLALEKLLPYQQDIIIRRYLKNEKVKDIAKEYNVSRNTMTNHMTRAMDTLRALCHVTEHS